jgi:hypothetical protein
MPTLEIWMLARLAKPAKTLANRFFLWKMLRLPGCSNVPQWGPDIKNGTDGAPLAQ